MVGLEMMLSYLIEGLGILVGWDPLTHIPLAIDPRIECQGAAGSRNGFHKPPFLRLLSRESYDPSMTISIFDPNTTQRRQLRDLALRHG